MSRPVAPLIEIAAGRSALAAPKMVASAIEHRMGGLLLSAGEDGLITLPSDAMTELTAAELAMSGWHDRLWEVLADVVTTLGEAGIETVAIKGVTNERRWYRRLGERPCTDVDLVLAPDHVDRIDEALALLAPSYPTADAAVEMVRRRQLQHVHFMISGVTVDLHLDPLKLGVWTGHQRLWWATTTTVTAPDGTPIRVLAPEIALVGALTHLNKDRFAYLGAYAEVDRIASDPSLDWDRVEAFAEAEGLQVPFWSSLAAVVEALALDASAWNQSAPEATASTVAGRCKRALWEHCWDPESRLQGHEGRRSYPKRQLLIPLLMRHRGREALAELRRSAFPSPRLIEINDQDRSGHGYLRRITFDRMGQR